MTVVHVFGGSGFVGASVCQALRELGADVKERKAPRVPLPSLRDVESAIRSFDGDPLAASLRDVDVVINAAGSPDASATDDLLLFSANACTAGVIARAAEEAGVRRLVHVSSAVVQGSSAVLDNTMAVEGFSPYARSKIAGEELVLRHPHSVVYRPPSVHGIDRRVSRLLSRIASSPFASVAAPATEPSPQVLIQSAASAIAFLALCPGAPPPVVAHPSEGITTGGLMELLGGKRPIVVPAGLAMVIRKLLRSAAAHRPSLAPNVRRWELLWFGQRQTDDWLTTAGWRSPTNLEDWRELGALLRSQRAARGVEGGQQPRAVISCTIPRSAWDFYRPIMRELRSRGYELTLVSSPGPEWPKLEPLSDHSVQLQMERDISLSSDIHALVSWIALLRRTKPSVLFAGTPKAGLLAMIAGTMRRVPNRIYFLQGLRLEGATGHKRRVLVWMERLASACSTQVIAVSPSLADEFRSLRLNVGKEVHVALRGSSHGVDLDHFKPVPTAKGERRRLGLSEDDPVIAFVGRLTADKGPQTLLCALEIARHAGLTIQTVIVGAQDESDSERLAQSFASSGLPLAMVGQVSDVRPYVAMADILVLPTRREGMPNVVLEAAAMGIPAITTLATGARDSVVHGVTGRLVPVDDASAMAEALREMLEDESVLKSMGAAARRHVEEFFDHHAVAAAIVDLVDPAGVRTCSGTPLSARS